MVSLAGEKRKIIKHSGFICIDIDAKDNKGAADFDNLKDYIGNIKYVAFCARSVGGGGFYALIPIADTRKHTAHFDALKSAFTRCGITIDASCGDVGRLRFVSYDPNPYINPDAEPYPYYTVQKDNKRKERERAEGTPADLATIEALAKIAVLEGVDITAGYENWVALGFSLSNTFGEAGREAFHLFSSVNPDYRESQTDAKFQSFFEAGKTGKQNKRFGLSKLMSLCDDARLTVLQDFKYN